MPQLKKLPIALYRLQLLPSYSFKSAQKLLSDIAELGADTLFLSSIFNVEDVDNPRAPTLDFSQCHSKLGSAEDFSRLSESACDYKIGIVLSVRASFMCATLKNRIWGEVLQRGTHSPYARWFDIDWTPFHRKWVNQILVPALEEPFSRALEMGLFDIQFKSGTFCLVYRKQEYPLSYETWWTLVNSWVKVLSEKVANKQSNALLELTGIKNQLSKLCQRDNSATSFEVAVESKEKRQLSRKLDTFVKSHSDAQQALKLVLNEFKGGSTEAISKVEKILRLQAYRFSYLQLEHQEVNFRRLGGDYTTIALQMESPEVIQQVLDVPLALIRQKLITGICFEQMDLVANPNEMLQQFISRLHDDEAMTQSLYLITENSVGKVQKGTRSEECIDRLGTLALEHKKLSVLEEVYRKFVGEEHSFIQTFTKACQLLLRTKLRSEYLRLCAKGAILADLHYTWRETSFDDLEHGLQWLLIQKCWAKGHCRQVKENEDSVYEALEEIDKHLDNYSDALKTYLKVLFSATFPSEISRAQEQQLAAFCQMLEVLATTLCYLALKKCPESKAVPLACFQRVFYANFSDYSLQQLHEYLNLKQLESPFNPTLTHSELSILSEESRARLLLLSEIPSTWEKAVMRWHSLNADKNVAKEGKTILTPHEEYLLYQFLTATWIPGQSAQDYLSVQQIPLLKQVGGKSSRFKAYLEAVLLGKANPFTENLDRFVAKLHRYGLYNSLALTFLKLFGPGIPEIYHGTDRWSFGFEGYPLTLLEGEAVENKTMQWMFQNVETSTVKRSLIQQGLECRKRNPKLFIHGEYVPFTIKGVKGSHAFAFGRIEGRSTAIAVTTRLFLTLSGEANWEGHCLIADQTFSGEYRELFTGREFRLGGKGADFSLPLEELLSETPMVLLERLG